MTAAVLTLICAAAVHFKLPIGMRTMSLSTSNFQDPDALACTGERIHALQKTHSPHSRDDAKKKAISSQYSYTIERNNCAVATVQCRCT